MPIIPRSYYAAAEQGRQDAQAAQLNALRAQAAQQDVDQQNILSGLMLNPDTTPEQFARAGRSDIANSLHNLQPDQAAQAKEFATQMVNAAKYSEQVPQGQTKAFIEQNFPLLKQTYGAAWDQASDDQVRQELHGIAARFGVQAGIGPTNQDEKFGSPLPANYQGKPSMVQVSDRGTVRPLPGVSPIEKPSDTVDPTSVENTAQLIANNQIPMLSGFALKSKWGQDVISRVRELNPDYAGADYGSNAAGLKQFTSGKNGNTIRSLNVAVQHLDQLSQLATALNNGDIPSVNRLAIWWKRNTGNAAPTNFETAKKVVADEVVKAIVGSGGVVADREEAARSINAAGSPEQLQQAIQTYQGLMTGQLNGLREQYRAATGRNNFESMLLPETRAKLESHTADNSQSAPKELTYDPATGTFK